MFANLVSVSCGSQVSMDGSHGLSCKFCKGRHSRHTEGNTIIAQALSLAGYPSTMEPNGLSRNDGKRPDGMTLVPWTKGLSVIWDFTCVDSLAPSRIDKMEFKAANKQEEHKEKLYSSLSACHVFSPVSVETLGIWGDKSLDFLKEIGRRITKITGDARSGYHLRQRLSGAVARGNHCSVLGTLGQIEHFSFPFS